MSHIFNQKHQKDLRQKLRNRMTAPEVLLWSKLKHSQTGHKFRRQCGVGNYILDFYCPNQKLAIEIDGDSHFDELSKKADRIRDQFLVDYGIKVLRFNNEELMKNIDGVVGRIIGVINQPPLTPP